MVSKIIGLDGGSSIQASWLVRAPTNFRCGIDCSLVQVHEVPGRDPLGGRCPLNRTRHRSAHASHEAHAATASAPAPR